MNKTPLLLAVLLGSTLLASHADARERSRTVQRTAHGGSVAVDRSNPRFDSQRQRNWQADGQGNASGARSGSAAGAYGGHAGYQQSAYRNADGSAGRQGSAHANGRYGGSGSTRGALARDADGNVNGARSTNATGANGNHYSGSTTMSDGTLVHTRSCTNASGEAVACRGN
ncbi:hypothetical protein [Pseudoxanthomonas wuyuanensis]|uniref:hypothetical protein n=1 Tax=Pseudoxanthomonas wuyuanensis TaxID=1073196 RepID=UPI001EE4CFF8|nr:hypothetical protein [Pseudoxanthomonas wuyuanensis]